MTINSTTVGLSMEVLEKKNLKIEFPNNSSLSLLGIYPKGIKCSVKQRYIYTMPTMAVVIITFMVPVLVSITGWMNKDGVAHMHSAVYSEIKKNEIILLAEKKNGSEINMSDRISHDDCHISFSCMKLRRKDSKGV